MGTQSAELLKDAMACRGKARYARQLSWRADDPEMFTALTAYAAEFDLRAVALEAQALRIARLTNDLAGEVGKALQTVQDIVATLARLDPDMR